MTRLYSAGEVRRLANLTPKAMEYLIERDPALNAKLRVGGKRAFTGEELAAIKAAVSTGKAKKAREAVS